MSNITVTETISAKDDQNATPTVGTVTATGTTETLINQAFAAGSSSVSFALAFATASLKYIVVKSTANATLVFNLSGGGTKTIALIAGAAYRWNSSDGYFTNPFSADVTSLLVSCTPAAVLTGKVLV